MQVTFVDVDNIVDETGALVASEELDVINEDDVVEFLED
jgi:hypothetical protein